MPAPKVAASIKPVHSLVSIVLQGVGEPELLVTGMASPHDFHLKPSTTSTLNRADLVVYMGPQMEVFLAKSIEGLPKRVAVLHLLHGETKSDQHAEDAGNHDDHDHLTDAHAWLDPVFAISAVEKIAETMAAIDPENAAIYLSNASRFHKEADQLIADVETLLRSVRKQQYAVMHDAYGPFEARFKLKESFVIAPSNHNRPSAKQVRAVHKLIDEGELVCLFSEPLTNVNLVALITENRVIRQAMLDPSGARMKPGPDLYPNMLRSMAETMADCLAG